MCKSASEMIKFNIVEQIFIGSVPDVAVEISFITDHGDGPLLAKRGMAVAFNTTTMEILLSRVLHHVGFKRSTQGTGSPQMPSPGSIAETKQGPSSLKRYQTLPRTDMFRQKQELNVITVCNTAAVKQQT